MAGRPSGAGRPTPSPAYRRDLHRVRGVARRARRSTCDDRAARRPRRATSATCRAERRGAGVAWPGQLAAVRTLHRFLADEGHARRRPDRRRRRRPGCRPGLPKALTEDEVAALLAASVGDDPVARRDRAILEVLYGTGARISELVGLSLGDLDLDGGLVRVFGKGSKERIVPFGRLRRRGAGRLARPERPAARSRPSGGPAAATPRRCSSTTAAARLQPPGGVGGRRRHGRRAPASPRPAVAARAAPLVRHPHARPRRRHPRRAGAARPRLDHHDAGVHQGRQERLWEVTAPPTRVPGRRIVIDTLAHAGHLARRFVGSLSRRAPAPNREAWARSQLLPGELASVASGWRRRTGGTRSRSPAASGEIVETPTRAVMAAALLHDVGKIECGLGTFGRVAATVVGPRHRPLPHATTTTSASAPTC